MRDIACSGRCPVTYGHVHVEEADGGLADSARATSLVTPRHDGPGKRRASAAEDDHTTVELDGRVIHQPGGFDQLVWIDWSDRRCGSARGSLGSWRYLSSCSTSAVLPATVSVPFRFSPLFCATLNLTVPLPVPLAPEVMVIHVALLVAVQVQ